MLKQHVDIGRRPLQAIVEFLADPEHFHAATGCTVSQAQFVQMACRPHLAVADDLS